MPQEDPAQNHIDAIHNLIDYLIETCPDRFTASMNDRLYALLNSFQSYIDGQRLARKDWHLIGRDSHRSNYVTAQCAVLLGFVNELSALANTEAGEVLRDPLARLWKRLHDQHNMFFPYSLLEPG